MEEYSWDFKIPPLSRIRRSIRERVEDGAGPAGFVFSDLQFTTGFLSNVKHEL